MKKPLLFVVSMMLATVSLFAQPQKPTVAYSSFAEAAGDSALVYLYNVEYGTFLTGSNYWGTRACAFNNGATGSGNNSALADVYVGKSKVEGYQWQLAKSGEETEEGVPCYSIANKTTKNYLTADNWDGVWVDGDAGRPYNLWYIKDLGSNTFELYYDGVAGKLGFSEVAFGAEGNTNTFFIHPDYTYTVVVDEEETQAPAFSGKECTTWAVVSAEEYERVAPLLNAYYRAIGLKATIDATKEAYPGIDLSAVEAVYGNASSTVEDIEAALKLVSVAIDAYIDNKIDNATLADPVEITGKLTNVDGTTITDWTRKFTGTGSTGSFEINTWSVEGNPGNDGTNMVVNFIQSWVGKGSIISDQKFYRNPVKVKPGAYKITANIRLYNESGAETMEGAYLFGNINRTNLVGQEGATYINYNGMLGYWKDGFETYAVVTGDSLLSFGIEIENANFNWVAAKDFHVYYLGASYESLDYVRQSTELCAPEFEDDVLATKQLLADYSTARANYVDATSADMLNAACANLSLLADSLIANVAAYQIFVDSVAIVSDYFAEHDDLMGDAVDKVMDYVVNLDEECGPSSDDALYWGFPNGSATYILSQLTLTTEEIKAETSFLNEMFATAIKEGLADGSNLTDLIANPGFEEAGGKGWSLDTSKGGTSTLTSWHGGNANNYCAEAFQQYFDVYQVIDGVPNGLYEVSVQAFYRTAANAAAYDAYVNDPEMTGDAKVHAYVYLNDFATPVRNVMEIQFEDGELAGNENMYNTSAGTWTLDGMVSASNAFSLEDPEKNFTMSAYGLVTDGKIRLGIRRLSGETNNSSWTLWDNFKLTFRAKNAEVLETVINSYVERIDALANYGEPEAKALDVAVANAEDAVASGDGDEMYDALIALAEAYNAAATSVDAYAQFEEAAKNLDNALYEYESTASKEAINAALEITYSDEYSAAFNYELSSTEVLALIERINEAIAALKIPASDGASDENPVDFTSVIENADIEAGASVAWQYTKNGGNGPALDNGLGGTKSIEFWNEKATNLQFNVWQTLSKLPAGKYELSADASNSLNGQADAGEEGRAYLYAITSGGVAASTAVAVQEAGCTEAYDNYSVIFTLAEGENVTIGFQSVGTMTARWFVADNFTLTYYGTGSAKADTEDNGQVDIADVDVNAASVEGIYTISGTQVSSLQKGINIVKYADGKVKKVLVK